LRPFLPTLSPPIFLVLLPIGANPSFRTGSTSSGGIVGFLFLGHGFIFVLLLRQRIRPVVDLLLQAELPLPSHLKFQQALFLHLQTLHQYLFLIFFHLLHIALVLFLPFPFQFQTHVWKRNIVQEPACHYVLAHYLDMVITVGPCMLMPEANHMPQLVYHNAELVTVLANRNSLRSIATLPNKRTASTRPLCEQNVVGVFARHFLHKLDTREVLPVSHGLFE